MSIKWIGVRNWTRMEWEDFRLQGIGGSEIGAVLNISRWHDALRVHLQKIGENASTFSGNRYTRFGKFHEAHTIAPLYRYWDWDSPGEERMFVNQSLNRIINPVRNVEAYVVNSKWPWLFGSIDRRILRNRYNRRRGLLECKNTTKMEQDVYELGFSQDFYAQVQLYLMLTTWDYADIAMHIDGNDFQVIRVEPDPRWFEWITETSYDFWQNVLRCRNIKAEFGIDQYAMANEILFPVEQRPGIAALQSLEPESTGMETEHELVKELIKPTPEITRTVADAAIKDMVREYAMYGRQINDLEREKKRVLNNIIRWLGGISRAEDMDGFWVSYTPNRDGVKSINYNRPYIEGKLKNPIL